MTLLVDAGAVFAQADRDDPAHAGVAAVLRSERGELVISQIAMAEADYLVMTRLGVDAELGLLDDLAAGTFVAECLTRPELAAARDVVRQYRDPRGGSGRRVAGGAGRPLPDPPSVHHGRALLPGDDAVAGRIVHTAPGRRLRSPGLSRPPGVRDGDRSRPDRRTTAPGLSRFGPGTSPASGRWRAQPR